jgi:DNA-binding NtrC family response regulator
MSELATHILILDDDDDVAYAAHFLLRRRAEKVETLGKLKHLPALLEAGIPDIVLLDFNFTPGRTDGKEGLDALKLLRSLQNPPTVIAMTAYADVALAVEAMKRGAFDFITKPWDNARLTAVVESALARRAVPTSGLGGAASGALLGDAPAMREMRAFIDNVGPTEANVMVLGENGVGKELVARAIHSASRRAAGNFLTVDMGALPESTLESELFGHRKGSFTDARSDRSGRFQAAAGGTLFLDEIGNLPLGAQAKLLTALERREVTPLGADRPEAVDVRIVSATNLDEAKLYDAAVFRPDLLFRLNTIVIRVPALRERRDDIPALLRHYLKHYEQQYERPPRAISPSTFDVLCSHDWPGNVRALRHACERAVILGQSDEYTFADFGLRAEPGLTAAGPVSAPDGADALKLGELERDAIAAALAKAQGNITQAARLLGVSRAALYRKLDKHGL